jgi:hypothetical protein
LRPVSKFEPDEAFKANQKNKKLAKSRRINLIKGKPQKLVKRKEATVSTPLVVDAIAALAISNKINRLQEKEMTKSRARKIRKLRSALLEVKPKSISKILDRHHKKPTDEKMMQLSKPKISVAPIPFFVTRLIKPLTFKDALIRPEQVLRKYHPDSIWVHLGKQSYVSQGDDWRIVPWEVFRMHDEKNYYEIMEKNGFSFTNVYKRTRRSKKKNNRIDIVNSDLQTVEKNPGPKPEVNESKDKSTPDAPLPPVRLNLFDLTYIHDNMTRQYTHSWILPSMTYPSSNRDHFYRLPLDQQIPYIRNYEIKVDKWGNYERNDIDVIASKIADDLMTVEKNPGPNPGTGPFTPPKPHPSYDYLPGYSPAFIYYLYTTSLNKIHEAMYENHVKANVNFRLMTVEKNPGPKNKGKKPSQYCYKFNHNGCKNKYCERKHELYPPINQFQIPGVYSPKKEQKIKLVEDYNPTKLEIDNLNYNPSIMKRKGHADRLINAAQPRIDQPKVDKVQRGRSVLEHQELFDFPNYYGLLKLNYKRKPFHLAEGEFYLCICGNMHFDKCPFFKKTLNICTKFESFERDIPLNKVLNEFRELREYSSDKLFLSAPMVLGAVLGELPFLRSTFLSRDKLNMFFRIQPIHEPRIYRQVYEKYLNYYDDGHIVFETNLRNVFGIKCEFVKNQSYIDSLGNHEKIFTDQNIFKNTNEYDVYIQSLMTDDSLANEYANNHENFDFGGTTENMKKLELSPVVEDPCILKKGPVKTILEFLSDLVPFSFYDDSIEQILDPVYIPSEINFPKINFPTISKGPETYLTDGDEPLNFDTYLLNPDWSSEYEPDIVYIPQLMYAWPWFFPTPHGQKYKYPFDESEMMRKWKDSLFSIFPKPDWPKCIPVVLTYPPEIKPALTTDTCSLTQESYIEMPIFDMIVEEVSDHETEWYKQKHRQSIKMEKRRKNSEKVSSSKTSASSSRTSSSSKMSGSSSSSLSSISVSSSSSSCDDPSKIKNWMKKFKNDEETNLYEESCTIDVNVPKNPKITIASEDFIVNLDNQYSDDQFEYYNQTVFYSFNEVLKLKNSSMINYKYMFLDNILFFIVYMFSMLVTEIFSGHDTSIVCFALFQILRMIEYDTKGHVISQPLNRTILQVSFFIGSIILQHIMWWGFSFIFEPTFKINLIISLIFIYLSRNYVFGYPIFFKTQSINYRREIQEIADLEARQNMTFDQMCIDLTKFENLNKPVMTRVELDNCREALLTPVNMEDVRPSLHGVGKATKYKTKLYRMRTHDTYITPNLKMKIENIIRFDSSWWRFFGLSFVFCYLNTYDDFKPVVEISTDPVVISKALFSETCGIRTINLHEDIDVLTTKLLQSYKLGSTVNIAEDSNDSREMIYSNSFEYSKHALKNYKNRDLIRSFRLLGQQQNYIYSDIDQMKLASLRCWKLIQLSNLNLLILLLLLVAVSPSVLALGIIFVVLQCLCVILETHIHSFEDAEKELDQLCPKLIQPYCKNYTLLMICSCVSTFLTVSLTLLILYQLMSGLMAPIIPYTGKMS